MKRQLPIFVTFVLVLTALGLEHCRSGQGFLLGKPLRGPGITIFELSWLGDGGPRSAVRR